MLLKKQTVWLLTMLSLVVVLSVYYMTSPDQRQQELAATEEKEEAANQEEEGVISETETEGEVISSVASDEVFDALRLQLDEERSKYKEELRDIMASTELPSEERGDAYDKIQNLDQVAQKEAVLETLIVAMGYDDALVRADGERVRITVKSNEPSASAANEIIQVVKTELGQMQAVAVEFQPNE
ncbi:stage III sporulation protein AH [Robertmurraya siralis]|uniref:Stage III sporulation protein AH n=1 Tax=Robertmurraya siralis TaxID=77777 RepID=A0A919WF37_9BACI|nr:SpoIIIAH-like family protein [Robertmurraya siralis]PAE22131.1 stage III sporulation protein AH [Bacillus sp. 7504-2]GIN60584.1 stage III sporulation protein AH [Robertmurraya siralis]